jgi:SAM-dependent methyltransferase
MNDLAGSFDKENRAQIQAQVDYYARRRPVRMLAVDTPYVRRHFAEAMRVAELGEGERVCEWGAGMGRFSVLFAQRGCTLTAIELSPELATICRDNIGKWPQARVEVGDVLEVMERLEPIYTLLAGFFTLHHLHELEPYFRAARRLLLPGGRFVFVEPNPLNPLYLVQIICTPGMRLREESGIYRMWPNAIRRAAEAAGFERFRSHRYGFLPRAPYNLAARIGAERWPEYLTPVPLRPFQIFTAQLASNSQDRRQMLAESSLHVPVTRPS